MPNGNDQLHTLKGPPAAIRAAASHLNSLPNFKVSPLKGTTRSVSPSTSDGFIKGQRGAGRSTVGRSGVLGRSGGSGPSPAKSPPPKKKKTQ